MKMKICSSKKLLRLVLMVVSFFGLFIFSQTALGLNLFADIWRLSITKDSVQKWTKDVTKFCSGNFIGFGHQFALLQNVVLEPDNKYFQIPCDKAGKLSYTFSSVKGENHLTDWMKLVKSYQSPSYNDVKLNNKLVVVVMRYEYANLYHTMTDWYNVFLMMKLFNKTEDDISVLIFNSNPPGALDKTWTTLFTEVTFKADQTETLKYKEMVWSIQGYESPLNYHSLKKLPFMQDFHNFFLHRHGISGTKSLNCQKLRILFLWRRDYVAHPGNPTGLVSRKVKNEHELIDHLQKHYPDYEVRGAQLDQHEMKVQLELMTQTDILISMHGAGLSHILFLPSHAGVIELFPLYWLNIGFFHFKAMARWRGIKHLNWQNYNPTNEYAAYNTRVPPYVIHNLVQQINQQICPAA